MATYTTDRAAHATTERDGEAINRLLAATMTALDWLTNLSLMAPAAFDACHPGGPDVTTLRQRMAAVIVWASPVEVK